MLIGWDLDTRIPLDEPGGKGDPPNCLGPFVSWLVKHRPGLKIYMLAWSGMAYSVLGRGTTLVRMGVLARQQPDLISSSTTPIRRRAATTRRSPSSTTPSPFAAASTSPPTAGTRASHLDDEPGRRRPTTRRRYPPWHDATMAVDGAAALALGELARLRWEAATEER